MASTIKWRKETYTTGSVDQCMYICMVYTPTMFEHGVYTYCRYMFNATLLRESTGAVAEARVPDMCPLVNDDCYMMVSSYMLMLYNTVSSPALPT